MTNQNIPPSSFEEKLKGLLVPPKLYIHFRAAKELRKGERELHLLPLIVPRHKVALDIGANKGVWAYCLSKICPQVHAFEPNPKMYQILKRGAAANVKTHPIALSDQSGTAELRVPKGTKGYSNQGASLSEFKVDGEFMSVSVESKRLDDMDFGEVGFIKLDVEGFELSVLKGAAKTIERDHPVMLIEMEARHTGRPLDEMIREVEAYGYTAYALSDDGLQTFARTHNGNHRDHHGKYLFNFVFLPKD